MVLNLVGLLGVVGFLFMLSQVWCLRMLCSCLHGASNHVTIIARFSLPRWQETRKLLFKHWAKNHVNLCISLKRVGPTVIFMGAKAFVHPIIWALGRGAFSHLSSLLLHLQLMFWQNLYAQYFFEAGAYKMWKYPARGWEVTKWPKFFIDGPLSQKVCNQQEKTCDEIGGASKV